MQFFQQSTVVLWPLGNLLLLLHTRQHSVPSHLVASAFWLTACSFTLIEASILRHEHDILHKYISHQNAAAGISCYAS
jgi:hypothetical protein